MSGKKHFKDLEKRLASLGYEFVEYSGSMWRYENGSGGHITVNPGLNEQAARQIIRKLERDAGQVQKSPKRNAAAIKTRQAEERRLLKEEADRLDRDRLRLLAERDCLLGGAASHLTNSEIRDLERRVEEIERERRAIEKLMTGVPAPLDNPAKHRAGQR